MADIFVVVAAVLGVAALAGFVAVEYWSRAPMVSLALFRSRNFTGANLLTLFLYASLGGLMFFFPMDLIQIQHYSTTQAGAAFLPFVVIMFGLSRWAGGLGCALWITAAAYGWAAGGSVRDGAVRDCAAGWELLDYVLPGCCGDGPGHGDQCRSFDDDGDERRAGIRIGRCFRNQQCGFAFGFAAGSRCFWCDSGDGFQSFAGSSTDVNWC